MLFKLPGILRGDDPGQHNKAKVPIGFESGQAAFWVGDVDAFDLPDQM